MAFPTLIGVTEYTVTVGADPHSVPLPELNANDAVVVAARSGSVVINSASGLTAISTLSNGSQVFYHKASTYEAATNSTFDLASSARLNCLIMRYANVDQCYPASTVAQSTSATPPALNPGLGAQDFEWIVTTTNSQTYDAAISVTAAPTDYSNLTAGQTLNTSGTSAWTGVARRALNAASETPGAFTWGGSPTSIRSFTIALSGLASLSLDTPLNKIQSGKALTLTGTGFGASQGAGSVIISPTNTSTDINAVAPTITSWADTSITINSVSLPAGTGAGDTIYVFVQDDSLNEVGSGAALVADPTLRVNRTLKDTDAGTAITQDPLEVIVLTGAAGSRTVELNVTTEAAAAGVVEIDNSAFSIDELTDTKLVLMRQSDTRMGVDFATVVDRNDD